MKSALLVLIFIAAVAAIQENSKIYPTPLRTQEDCEVFSKQKKFSIVKAWAYYDFNTTGEKKLYLDKGLQYSLADCAACWQGELTYPSIIYHTLNSNDFSQMDIAALEGQTDEFVEMIPQVTYYLGPGGKTSDVSKGLETLKVSWIAVRVAETERHTAYYGQKFFDDLNLIAPIRTPTKYLILNGWHLKNMQVAPNLDGNLLRLFDGLIIWVEPRTANLIGKNQVVKFLNGTQFPVFFDMDNSPDYLTVGGVSQCHGTYSILFLPFMISFKLQ